jgi:hypothetical protein
MNLVSRWQKQGQNRSVAIGLAFFIVLYFLAAVCFIILE